MIKFITAEYVLPLRNEILRDGKLTLNECVFDNDNEDSTFHLGYVIDEEIICVASFYWKSKGDFGGVGYQLRGMATATNFQGKCYGNRLMNFALVYLRGQKVNYLWCNAREKAFKFYLGLGFEFISDKFEIPDIGTHRVMYLKIK